MSERFLEPTSQPLFREEHGQALHLKLGRRHLAELALRLALASASCCRAARSRCRFEFGVNRPAAPL